MRQNNCIPIDIQGTVGTVKEYFPCLDKKDPHPLRGDTTQLKTQESELIKERMGDETVTETSRDEKFNDVEKQPDQTE